MEEIDNLLQFLWGVHERIFILRECQAIVQGRLRSMTFSATAISS